jgi:hypothetical protein
MFTIQLKTKPYVRHFLVSNFGSPANLTADPGLNALFRRCLKKPSLRSHKHYKPLNLKKYTTTAEIIISDDYFYRYGWEMSKTDTILFGRELENRAKFLMRSIVSVYMAFMRQKDAIMLFQENFGYTEDIWSYDSIKKDYFRNGPEKKIDFLTEITRTTENIILENLSSLGTISHNLVKNHACRN